MKLHAILWDGFNKIQGKLHLGKERLTFELDDFKETDLVFGLSYNEIKEVNFHRAYEREKIGIEVISRENKVNIFIVAKPRDIRNQILEKLVLFQSIK